MDKEYYSSRLHVKLLDTTRVSDVLDFLIRNRNCFEIYEEPKPKDYYTVDYQSRVLNVEAATFNDSFYMRYYLSPLYNKNIIGTVSFKKYQHNNCTTMLVGYKIDKNFQRQGYAYEALSLLIPRIFFTGEATRLEALVDATNTPSINLLKKLGFIHHSDDIAFRNIGRGNTLHHLYSLESPISVKDMHQ